jgi:hypothetical protein
MGLVHAELTLTNAGDISLYEGGFIKENEIRNVNCIALVDSGAIMMAINENLKIQLGLKVRDVRPAQLVDGTVKNLEIVGPIEVRFKNRMSITSAMVLPGNQEVFLTCPPSIRYKKKGLNINALYSFFVILTALKGQKCFILEL